MRVLKLNFDFLMSFIRIKISKEFEKHLKILENRMTYKEQILTTEIFSDQIIREQWRAECESE